MKRVLRGRLFSFRLGPKTNREVCGSKAIGLHGGGLNTADSARSLKAIIRCCCRRLLNGAELAMYLSLALFGIAHAAEETQVSPGAAKGAIDRVEVFGNASVANRREANAAKLVVTRDDLTRFGDTTVADALQRVPGLSVSRSQGGDVEIRLRGLGNGYTQILVDGSPVPRGFSIETLSPELIERIEVLRSPTVDLSSQAIAGTINIILKGPTRRSTHSAKIAFGGYDDRPSANASLDLADKSDNLSWGISSTASLTNDRWPTTSISSAAMPSGESIYSRTNMIDEQNRLVSVALAPSVEYRTGERSSISLNGWLQSNDVHYSNVDQRSDVSGEPPQFVNDVLTTDARTLQGRVTGQLKAPFGESGRIETKLLLTGSHRNSEAVLTGNDANNDLLLRREIHSEASEKSASLVGKVLESVEDSHAWSVGWDGEMIERSENRSQREFSPVSGYPTEDLDEDYTARIGRLALFAQDEWAISPKLNVYLGLRWEGLQTRTEGNTLAAVSVRSGVFSPVAQLLWKVPETKADQLRLNLGRTYKAPTARELIPRRWVVNDNTATTPNFQGNPNLQPELAWGLDIGYERYLEKKGFVGVSAFARRIDNVILPSVSLVDGVWIQTPQNSGRANVLGLAFEAKGNLQALLKDSPNVDVRFGVTRNWSEVMEVPGPGNRLARQPRATASVGADWHVDQTNWTAGANYTFEEGGYSRGSLTTATVTPYVRKLDLYGLWEPSRSERVRISVSNALAPPEEKSAIYADDNLVAVESSRTQTFVAVKVQLELTF